MKVILSKIITLVLVTIQIFNSFPATGQIAFDPVKTPRSCDFPLAITDIDFDWQNDVLSVSDDGWLFHTSSPEKASTYTLIDSLENTGVGNVSWFSIATADVNNDQVNDIFVGDFKYSKLFISNGSGGYNKSTLPDTFFAQAASFVDINLDGNIDLFVCNDDSMNFVYLGDGNGNFNKDTSIFPTSESSGNYGLVWSDIDGDLDMDLYISKCKAGVFDSTDVRRINVLYVNNGNGTYTEKASDFGIADGSQSWSSDFGDIDNDGDMDLLIANHHSRNRLYEQVNDTFIEITYQSGMDYDDRFDYQSSFIDFDNDGYLDIIIANSDTLPLIYKNNGDNTFTPVKTDVPVSVRSFAIGDLNFDHFPEIYSSDYEPDSSDRIWYNRGNSNNAFTIALEGSSSNPNNIGASLKLFGTWGSQNREIRGGESYGIQHSQYPTFGIGQNTEIDSLFIHWPDGHQCTIYNIDINAFNFVSRACQVSSLDVGIPTKHVQNHSKLIIYPNPTSDFISWNTDFYGKNTKAKIYDNRGSLILKREHLNSNEKLNISNIKNGTYLLIITFDGVSYQALFKINR